ncbi:hypothetical protein [Nonomuraea sp. bgisy101]
MRRTLEFVNERAGRYTDEAREIGEDPRAQLELLLLLELQDTPTVRENSAAWGELRASAVFDPDLREPLSSSATLDRARELVEGAVTAELGRR